MARRTRIALLLVAAISGPAAGCATGGAGTVSLRAVPPSPTTSASALPQPPGKCCVPPAEPSLQIHAEPSYGPPGTRVRLRITGCGDVDPANVATVSYNNDSESTVARNDPGTVVDLGLHRGSDITLTYTVAASDRTGGVGRFYVQCGQTLVDTVFTVT